MIFVFTLPISLGMFVAFTAYMRDLLADADGKRHGWW